MLDIGTVFSFFHCMYTPEGHHLRERLYVILSRIFQAGLFNPLRTTMYLSDLKTQSVPRSRHLTSVIKPVS